MFFSIFVYVSKSVSFAYLKLNKCCVFRTANAQICNTLAYTFKRTWHYPSFIFIPEAVIPKLRNYACFVSPAPIVGDACRRIGAICRHNKTSTREPLSNLTES